MSKIFSVYASNGLHNYVELDLPASDYEMLDLMERLRLEPGNPPYLEILEYHAFEFLEKCIAELPDVRQLNALAGKLLEINETDVRGMAAFEGLVGMEIRKKALPISVSRLIDFAHSADCCHVVEDAATDCELGRFLAGNGFVSEAEKLSDAAFELLDFGKIGKEHREAEGGVYTSFGYVEPHEDVRHASETMDFQPRKPAYTVLLNVAALPLTGPVRQEDMLQLRLPAPEEQMREALEKLGAESWRNVAASIWDCPIPRLNHTMYLDGEAPQILELSKRLQELDARGELPRYKAILAAMDCGDIGQAAAIATAVDEYMPDK